MQTKKQSIIEAICNVGSGMVIALSISQLAVVLAPYIPGFEYQMTLGSNVAMTIILTFVSVTRSYIWRRYFNNSHKKPCKCEVEEK